MTDTAPKYLDIPDRFVPSPRLRRWLYVVAGAAVALLIFVNVLPETAATPILELVASILGVGSIGANALAAANTPKAVAATPAEPVVIFDSTADGV